MRLGDIKIIAGGQTGADRATLDWAIAHGIPHGGWCPKGRWAEDGPIPARYALRETPSAEPAQRTEWNVRDSDGTVIFSIHANLSGGTLLAAQFARKYQKPLLHIFKMAGRESGVGDSVKAELLRGFLQEHEIRILNIAGPRASEEAAIGKFVTEMLEGLCS